MRHCPCGLSTDVSTTVDMTKKKNLPHPRGYSSFPEGGSVKKTAEEISPAVCIIE